MSKVVRISITASLDETHPMEWYLDDDGNELSDEDIGEIVDEQAAEMLVEGGANWDVYVRVVEK
jgi:hypothetical protein